MSFFLIKAHKSFSTNFKILILNRPSFISFCFFILVLKGQNKKVERKWKKEKKNVKNRRVKMKKKEFLTVHSSIIVFAILLFAILKECSNITTNRTTSQPSPSWVASLQFCRCPTPLTPSYTLIFINVNCWSQLLNPIINVANWQPSSLF